MILDVCVPSVISLVGGSEGGSQGGGSQDGSQGGSSYQRRHFCNSLKLTEEDTTASDKMKADAAKHFRDINCTLDDACDICYLEENPNPEGQGQEGQGQGGEQKEYRPVPCNPPLACPVPTTTTTTARSVPAKPGDGDGNRKKRQAGFQQRGGKGSKQEYSSQAQVDFDTEANFIHQLMKVPPKYRYN